MKLFQIILSDKEYITLIESLENEAEAIDSNGDDSQIVRDLLATIKTNTSKMA